MTVLASLVGRRPPVIAILGIDGSGKTTQAKLLAKWLRDEGRRASYFENPGGRPITDFVARRVGRGDTRGLLGGHGQVLVETSVRSLALARAAMWSRVTGCVAVMDRHASCQVALVRARGDRGERAVRTVMGPFGAPDLVVFLTVPEAVAQRRIEERGYDREELAYLAAFREAYESLPEWPIFRIVDASGSVDDVQATLREIVGAFVAA